jgi:hydroxylysine kinase
MQQNDPLAVIETEAPNFSDEEAIAVIRNHYGIDVTVQVLVSERDQNFRLRSTDGVEYVLKIASVIEDPQVTDFQIQALLHLQAWCEQNRFPLNAPQIIRTTDGETQISMTSATGEHVARIVTYVAGVPLGDRQPSPILATKMGRYLAQLGRALQDFRHPGNSQVLLWDMQQALELKRLLPHIANEALRSCVEQVLIEFEQIAWPKFPHLRAQVIHSDFNPDNVLTFSDDDESVAGVIDFGDMLLSPLVVDVAIAASYLWAEDGNPLALIAEFLAGYHAVTPLTLEELEILHTLIKTRLAASISIHKWRASFRGVGDPYLAKIRDEGSPTENFLSRLSEIPLEHAMQTFRQICASVELASN